MKLYFSWLKGSLLKVADFGGLFNCEWHGQNKVDNISILVLWRDREKVTEAPFALGHIFLYSMGLSQFCWGGGDCSTFIVIDITSGYLPFSSSFLPSYVFKVMRMCITLQKV